MGEETTEDLTKRIRKMEMVLQDFGKFFMDYKTETEKKIGELSSMVNAMRTELINMKSDSSSRGTASQPVAAAVQPAKKPNARTGDAVPGQFDINEIFSNAHGKMMKR
jgi:hypothetical protein